jgi:hypothetical protein
MPRIAHIFINRFGLIAVFISYRSETIEEVVSGLAESNGTGTLSCSSDLFHRNSTSFLFELKPKLGACLRTLLAT